MIQLLLLGNNPLNSDCEDISKLRKKRKKKKEEDITIFSSWARAAPRTHHAFVYHFPPPQMYLVVIINHSIKPLCDHRIPRQFPHHTKNQVPHPTSCYLAPSVVPDNNVNPMGHIPLFPLSSTDLLLQSYLILLFFL